MQADRRTRLVMISMSFTGKVDFYGRFGDYKNTSDLNELFIDYPHRNIDAAYAEEIDYTTAFIILFKQDMFWKYRVSYTLVLKSRCLSRLDLQPLGPQISTSISCKDKQNMVAKLDDLLKQLTVCYSLC